jgi:hypothetical protein
MAATLIRDPLDRRPDPYELLGVPTHADRKTIDAAFARALRQRAGREKEVREAKAVLSRIASRVRHDVLCFVADGAVAGLANDLPDVSVGTVIAPLPAVAPADLIDVDAILAFRPAPPAPAVPAAICVPPPPPGITLPVRFGSF